MVSTFQLGGGGGVLGGVQKISCLKVMDRTKMILGVKRT